MELTHLNKETTDGTVRNLDALYQLFPSCFTEAQDAITGKMRRVVDWSKLRELLGEYVETNEPEKYDFTWVGKRAAQREAAAPCRKTLRPCPEESVDWDTTQNLYIEGDNLEVLKLLQNSYMGKVKMIYIDPPYNTGNDFVYHDDFAQSAEEYDEHNLDDEGNRYRKNTDSNGRFHSDWCSMIYARLMVARSLLTEDGVIFISIDDNEVENLRKISNDIFGENNFVADISWQKTYSPKNNNTGISAEVEHIIVFSKKEDWTPNRLPRTEQMDSLYKNPDNDKSNWTSSDAFAPGAVTHQGMVYAVQSPFTGELIYPTKGRCWCREQKIVFENISKWAKYKLVDLHDEDMRADICGINKEDVRKGVCGIMLDEPLEEAMKHALALYNNGPWPLFYFTKGGQGRVRRKAYLDEMDGRIVTNLWTYDEVGHNDEAKKELKNLFSGNAPFDTPKPTRLVKRMLDIATTHDSTVLDFFSGSGTTAQAIMQKNAEDSGNRHYILVQLKEECNVANYSNLCEIGKERIRRAGKKIKADSPLTTKDLDIGFRVLKCDDSNYKPVAFAPKDYTQESLDMFLDNIKEERTGLDLLFDCMMRWGLELSLPYETQKMDGCTIYNVDDGNLVACFDGVVTGAVIDAIAETHPLRVVFRDSSFTEAAQKMNLFELFKQKCGWTDQEVQNNVRVI